MHNILSYYPQLYVGDDYYCESGGHSPPSDKWYMDNPLWNGQGCHSPPIAMTTDIIHGSGKSYLK